MFFWLSGDMEMCPPSQTLGSTSVPLSRAVTISRYLGKAQYALLSARFSGRAVICDAHPERR